MNESHTRLSTACLLVLTGLAIAMSLYWLKPVLVPFVLAVFLWVGLTPVVAVQQRRLRLPRKLAIVSTLLLGFVLLVVVGAAISLAVSQLADNTEEYKDRLQEVMSTAVEALPLEKLGATADATTAPLLDGSVEIVGNLLAGTTRAVGSVLSNGMLVILLTAFLLFGGTTAGASRGKTWGEVQSRIQRYVVTKFGLSALTGVLVALELGILGVDLALVFGLLAFLLNFIPNIGSFIAVVLPLPVILLSPDLTMPVRVLAFALPGATELVIGNVLEPKVMGESVGLHPVAVLLSLIFWGMLWGVIGMFLATPLTAALRVVLEKNEMTAPVARLLAGRFG